MDLRLRALLGGGAALITGASSGIGAAFARRLAREGMTLVLVARSDKRLSDLASELRKEFGVRVETLPLDLTEEGAALRAKDFCDDMGLSVTTLVNNAGFGMLGHFDGLGLDTDRRQVLLNCAAVSDMCHAFLPAMAALGKGVIINVASTAAFQPVPFMAVYGATKAFVLSFSEALTVEAERYGVRVICVSPGPTETAFFQTSGEGAAVGKKRLPAQVVETALRGLAKGQSSVVDGGANAVLCWVGDGLRALPRRLVARIAGKSVRVGPRNPAGASAYAANRSGH